MVPQAAYFHLGYALIISSTTISSRIQKAEKRRNNSIKHLPSQNKGTFEGGEKCRGWIC